MSLTAALRAGLRNFENLIENKHMNDTNHHQTSTPDADICGELRTMSGQEVTGKVHHSIQFQSRDAAIESLCKVIFGGSPVYPDQPAPAPSGPVAFPVWNGIGEPGSVMPIPDGSDALTAPSKRPTPRTDAARKHCAFKLPLDAWADYMAGTCVELERELAESRANAERADEAVWAWKQATDMLAEVREQRDRLATTLGRVRGYVEAVHGKTMGDDVKCFTLQDIDEALAAVKGTTILGMPVVIDSSLPPGTAEFRDPNTGKTIHTIKVTE